MANIFEFLSKDGKITPEKARKSRQMQFHDKAANVWMGILPLKKRVNCDKCSLATKQRMFGVFAIDEILRYRGTQFPGSRTLCHPVARYRTVEPRAAYFSPVQPCTVQYSPVEFSTAQYSPQQPTKPHYNSVHYIPVQHNTAQYSLVQPSIGQYSPVLPNTIQ